MKTANRALLSPETISIQFLCCRWAELTEDLKTIKRLFSVGKGSHYLFVKLQRIQEEHDQLDALLKEIYRMDKEALEKLAA
jgi:hypothetical protein